MVGELLSGSLADYPRIIYLATGGHSNWISQQLLPRSDELRQRRTLCRSIFLFYAGVWKWAVSHVKDIETLQEYRKQYLSGAAITVIIFDWYFRTGVIIPQRHQSDTKACWLVSTITSSTSMLPVITDHRWLLCIRCVLVY